MLGRGSFGEVYLADDKAVKAIKLKAWEEIQSAVKELYVLRQNIEGCIRYHSSFYRENNKTLYIYMDLADGDLRRMQAPPGASEQLLEAVYNLHSHNILHMDIKPENILVKGDRILLCDFGLSNPGGHFKTGTYVVSRWYRAPELYFSKQTRMYYTSAMDAWSVGCVLYEIKHGHPLNNKMSFTFNIKDEMIKNLTSFHYKKRWTVAKCLGRAEPSCTDRVTLSPYYKTYYEEHPSKLKMLEMAQRLLKSRCPDMTLLESALLMDDIQDYKFEDDKLSFIKHFIH